MILAIDPGTRQSGWAVLDAGRVTSSGVAANPDMLGIVGTYSGYVVAELLPGMVLAIERFEARGMPIGDESIDTILWSGRFAQAWHAPEEVRWVRRSAVKLELCGTSRAKDPHVRQVVIDRIGPPGTKRAPGPTYGVTSHAWAALAVALVAACVNSPIGGCKSERALT